MRIESPPLNDEHTNRDVDTDLDTDRAPWLGGTVVPQVSRVISSGATAYKIAGE
jgi:hypothetical protein